MVKPWCTCRRAEVRKPERAPRTFSRTSPKRPHQWRTAWQQLPLFPKPGNATHAMCERAKRCHRSGNVPRDCPKSIVERSQRIAGESDTTTERFSPPNA